MSYLGACDVCVNILLLLLIVAFVKNVLYLICQPWLQNFRSLPCLYTKPLFYAQVVFLKKWARIKNGIPINNGICGVLRNRAQWPKDIKLNMRGHKLCIGINWQGRLKQNGGKEVGHKTRAQCNCFCAHCVTYTYVYDLLLYQVSHAKLCWLISYLKELES